MTNVQYGAAWASRSACAIRITSCTVLTQKRAYVLCEIDKSRAPSHTVGVSKTRVERPPRTGAASRKALRLSRRPTSGASGRIRLGRSGSGVRREVDERVARVGALAVAEDDGGGGVAAHHAALLGRAKLGATDHAERRDPAEGLAQLFGELLHALVAVEQVVGAAEQREARLRRVHARCLHDVAADARRLRAHRLG
eukprot:5751856-Prymnesium_polylepis.2